MFYYCAICHKMAVFITFDTKMSNLNILYMEKKVWSQLFRQKQECHANFSVTMYWCETLGWKSHDWLWNMFVLSWHHSSLTHWLWLTGTDTSARWTSVQSSVVWSEPCLHGDEIHRNNMCNYFPPSLSECFW